MKTFQNLSRQLLECLRFGRQLISYVLIFASAFFRSRALLGCELVTMRSQLAFYVEAHEYMESNQAKGKLVVEI